MDIGEIKRNGARFVGLVDRMERENKESFDRIENPEDFERLRIILGKELPLMNIIVMETRTLAKELGKIREGRENTQYAWMSDLLEFIDHLALSYSKEMGSHKKQVSAFLLTVKSKDDPFYMMHGSDRKTHRDMKKLKLGLGKDIESRLGEGIEDEKISAILKRFEENYPEDGPQIVSCASTPVSRTAALFLFAVFLFSTESDTYRSRFKDMTKDGYRVRIEDKGGGGHLVKDLSNVENLHISLISPSGVEVAFYWAEFRKIKKEKFIKIWNSRGLHWEGYNFGRKNPKQGEINNLNLRFWRRYGESAARVLLFALLTEARRRGIERIGSEKGLHDHGAGMRRQLREGILVMGEMEKGSGIRSNKIHLGVFPKLTVQEIQKILDEGGRFPTMEKARKEHEREKREAEQGKFSTRLKLLFSRLLHSGR